MLKIRSGRWLGQCAARRRPRGNLAKNNTALSCELLHVHLPFGVREHAYRSHQALEKIAGDEARQALQPAQAMLAAAGIAHTTVIRKAMWQRLVLHARNRSDLIVRHAEWHGSLRMVTTSRVRTSRRPGTW